MIAQEWLFVDEQPRDEDELRSFVATKLGDLQGQFSKLIATLNLLTPAQPDRRVRRMLYLVIVLVIVLYVLLGLHVAWTAGWLGS